LGDVKNARLWSGAWDGLRAPSHSAVACIRRQIYRALLRWLGNVLACRKGGVSSPREAAAPGVATNKKVDASRRQGRHLSVDRLASDVSFCCRPDYSAQAPRHIDKNLNVQRRSRRLFWIPVPCLHSRHLHVLTFCSLHHMAWLQRSPTRRSILDAEPRVCQSLPLDVTP
jgi:hypothetical protein